MEFVSNLSIFGWLAICFIATLIFVFLMLRGLKIGWGNKSVIVGKYLDNKLENLKKELENNQQKRYADTLRQKLLFKTTNEIDDILFTNLHKTVKKMDTMIYKTLEEYVNCPFPSLIIIDIFEDVLMERVYYNDMKHKLTGELREQYLKSIIQDLKDGYELFTMKLKKLHCGEEYPDWSTIMVVVEKLVRIWDIRSIKCYIEAVVHKINLYNKNIKNFETEEIKKQACADPLKKNIEYLQMLKKSLSTL